MKGGQRRDIFEATLTGRKPTLVPREDNEHLLFNAQHEIDALSRP